ncbi:MAG: methyltransferase domain-containing protein [Bacteroidetes bacterium]|nr:methyltransferase domain-containing protein [Bacteroidota bacterium]
MSNSNFKNETRKQWNNDPCGAVTAKEFEPGTPEFFNAVEKYRYEIYSPWLKNEIGFDRFKGKSVLEIGGGLGTDHIQFAKAGANTFDLDLAKEHLRLAKERFIQNNFRGNFIYGDAELSPFKDSSFDAVYSFGVLHHTPDTQKSIDEARRVLKSNGVAMIMLYYKHSYFYWFSLFFVKGILRGNLFKMNMDEIMSRFVEYSTSGARPLVKVYTKKQAREMFKDFSDIQIKIRQLTQEDFPIIGKFIPISILSFLSKFVGWNIFIRAIK